MVYGAEAVLPCDIIHDSPRVRMYEDKEADLDQQDSLDGLEEEHDIAKARSDTYVKGFSLISSNPNRRSASS